MCYTFVKPTSKKSDQVNFNFRGVSIKSMKAIFPYEHNFAEAVQKEFISIVKWLKIIHRKQRVVENQPLPSDLVIKVKYSLYLFNNYTV